jgi:hypothetical protein
MPPGPAHRDDAYMTIRTNLQPRQLTRVGGVCAVGAAALTILNGFVLAPGGPGDPGQSAAQIVKGATGLHNGTELGAFVDAFGVGLFLVFVLILGRLAEPAGGLLSRAASFMTAVFFAIDVVWAGAVFAFAEATVRNTDPNAAKALFLLGQSLLAVIAIPIALQYAALGLLIIKSHVLPAVMGWIAFLVAAVALVSVIAGIYSVLDAVGFAAFILSTILWPLVAGVLLFMRRQRAAANQGSDMTRPETTVGRAAIVIN